MMRLKRVKLLPFMLVMAILLGSIGGFPSNASADTSTTSEYDWYYKDGVNTSTVWGGKYIEQDWNSKHGSDLVNKASGTRSDKLTFPSATSTPLINSATYSLKASNLSNTPVPQDYSAIKDTAVLSFYYKSDASLTNSEVKIGYTDVSSKEAKIPLSEYTTYADAFQYVKIPLADLTPATGFNWAQISRPTFFWTRTSGNTDNYSRILWLDDVQLFYVLPPSQLVVTGTTGSNVNLQWTASLTTDVDHYAIYRDGAFIGNTVGNQTTYSDTTVTADNTYTYSVKAVAVPHPDVDPEGIVSSAVSVNAVAVSVAPPTNFSAVAGTGVRAATLTWNAPTMGDTPEKYTIYRDGEFLADVTPAGNSMTYEDTTVQNNHSYTYTVKTYAGGKYSGATDAQSVTILLITTPHIQSLTTNRDKSLTMMWTASAGVNLAKYVVNVSSNGTNYLPIEISYPNTSYTITALSTNNGAVPLSFNTAYFLTISCKNQSGDESLTDNARTIMSDPDQKVLYSVYTDDLGPSVADKSSAALVSKNLHDTSNYISGASAFTATYKSDATYNVISFQNDSGWNIANVRTKGYLHFWVHLSSVSPLPSLQFLAPEVVEAGITPRVLTNTVAIDSYITRAGEWICVDLPLNAIPETATHYPSSGSSIKNLPFDFTKITNILFKGSGNGATISLDDVLFTYYEIPVVTSVSLADGTLISEGAPNIPVNTSQIKLQFNNAIDAASLTDENITVTLNGTPLAFGTGSYNAMSNIYTLNLLDSLDYGQAYTLTIANLTAHNLAMQGSYVLHFTTEALPFTVDTFNIFKNDVPTSSIHAGDVITAKAVLTKGSGFSQDISLVLAVYNADGSIKDVKIASQKMEATDTTLELPLPYTVSDDDTGCKLKVFLWNNFTSIQSLADNLNYTVQ